MQLAEVKLEATIIAMKTRPIHNSVKKWANWAKSGVKSILEWIRIEGKNNREVVINSERKSRAKIERPFPTLGTPYQKPKKKTKRRGNTIYSTMRQTTLGGFISLLYRMTCTDQWLRGLLLYIYIYIYIYIIPLIIGRMEHNSTLRCCCHIYGCSIFGPSLFQ